MTRKFFFFSEMGYNAYPSEAIEKYGYSALMFPNSIFDREKARDLWQMFLQRARARLRDGLRRIGLQRASQQRPLDAGERQHLGRRGEPAHQGHDRADRQSAPDSRQSRARRRGDRDARSHLGRPHHLRIRARHRHRAALRRTPTPPTTASASRKRSSSSRRPGPCRARSAGRASTITCASSIRGSCRCKSRTRRSGPPES